MTRYAYFLINSIVNKFAVVHMAACIQVRAVTQTYICVGLYYPFEMNLFRNTNLCTRLHEIGEFLILMQSILVPCWQNALSLEPPLDLNFSATDFSLAVGICSKSPISLLMKISSFWGFISGIVLALRWVSLREIGDRFQILQIIAGATFCFVYSVWHHFLIVVLTLFFYLLFFFLSGMRLLD